MRSFRRILGNRWFINPSNLPDGDPIFRDLSDSQQRENPISIVNVYPNFDH